MPHIIVEHSKSLGTEIDMDLLLRALHDSLAGQEGIDKARIKTRAMPIGQSIVGDNPPGVGLMVHATLQLLEGRDVETRQAYGQGLYHILKETVHAKFPDCALTLDVREMNKDTYIL